MARSCGWITQWKEMLSENQMRIGRPRQMYLGYGERQYQEMRKRDPNYIPSPAKPSTPGKKKLIERHTSSFKIKPPKEMGAEARRTDKPATSLWCLIIMVASIS